MNIKLIVTDLDGTFFDSDHITISQRNIDAFRKAHEKGVKVAVASGRTKVLTDGILRQLPFLDYLITSNGAVTYDLRTGETVSESLLPSAQCKDIFAVLDSLNLPYEIYFDGKCYIGEKSLEKYGNEHIPEHFMKILRDHINVVKELSEFIEERGAEKINLLKVSAEQRAEIEEKARKTGELFTTSSIPGNMEMSHPHANKGYAVEALASSMGIGSENTMCFGDGENDVSMLRFAKYSFAMENGSNKAKRAANFQAGKNFECGVAAEIERYVLNEID